MLILRDVDPRGRTEQAMHEKAVIRQGEALQARVYAEQGVPGPAGKVLSYNEVVGKSSDRGILDGSFPDYCQLYLTRFNYFVQGHTTLVGMMATEVIRDTPDIDGLVRFDYISPLVPAEGNRPHQINARALVPHEPRRAPKTASYAVLTPLEALHRFSAHMSRYSLDRIVMRVTDGIGVSRDFLDGEGYWESPVEIWTPPTSARTRAEYATVLQEPVHLKAQFFGREPRITRQAAEHLMVLKYLIEGNFELNWERASKLDLVRCTAGEFEKNFGVNLYAHNQAVVRTLESVAEVAARNSGYIPFVPMTKAA